MTRGVEHGIEGILCLARRCGDELALTLKQTTLEDILQAAS